MTVDNLPHPRVCAAFHQVPVRFLTVSGTRRFTDRHARYIILNARVVLPQPPVPCGGQPSRFLFIARYRLSIGQRASCHSLRGWREKRVMVSMTAHDEDLLARFVDGDAEAFVAFYQRHLPAVLGFFLRRTGDPELTADLTAEVFAAALLAAERYRPGERPGAGLAVRDRRPQAGRQSAPRAGGGPGATAPGARAAHHRRRRPGPRAGDGRQQRRRARPASPAAGPARCGASARRRRTPLRRDRRSDAVLGAARASARQPRIARAARPDGGGVNESVLR